MPTPSFCSLEDAYSDWNSNKTTVNQIHNNFHNHPSLKPLPKEDSKQDTIQDNIQNNEYNEYNSELKNICPNCNNCLNKNNALQQKIIEQNIWPRPRWEPQYPNAYIPHDPFNRYWMNNVPQNNIEEFANIYENFNSGIKYNNSNTEALLQIILFILIALFIIQLIECLYAKYT